MSMPHSSEEAAPPNVSWEGAPAPPCEGASAADVAPVGHSACGTLHAWPLALALSGDLSGLIATDAPSTEASVLTEAPADGYLLPPVFSHTASQVVVLPTPTTFATRLLAEIAEARHRILLTSLYLGTGPVERTLTAALHEALAREPGLQVHIVLDAMRGTRPDGPTGEDTGDLTSTSLPDASSGPAVSSFYEHLPAQSSLDLLRPLWHTFGADRVQLSFYHTPDLNGLLKAALPPRFNEVIGVQHAKAYIVDDNCILSGANLAGQYFTTRQDRYILLSRSADLSDYYWDFGQVLRSIGRAYAGRLPAGSEPPPKDRVERTTVPDSPDYTVIDTLGNIWQCDIDAASDSAILRQLGHNRLVSFIRMQRQKTLPLANALRAELFRHPNRHPVLRASDIAPSTYASPRGGSPNGLQSRSTAEDLHSLGIDHVALSSPLHSVTTEEAELLDTFIVPFVQAAPLGVHQDALFTRALFRGPSDVLSFLAPRTPIPEDGPQDAEQPPTVSASSASLDRQTPAGPGSSLASMRPSLHLATGYLNLCDQLEPALLASARTPGLPSDVTALPPGLGFAMLAQSQTPDHESGPRDVPPGMLASSSSGFSSVDLLTAAPEANGFFGANGIARHVPSVYTQISRDFLHRVESTEAGANAQGGQIRLWEWAKAGWTFHGKGIWYRPTSTEPPSMTMVGSPNYGHRSTTRDIESQIMISTANPDLRRRLADEQAILYSPVARVTGAVLDHAQERRVALGVRAAVYIVRRFF